VQHWFYGNSTQALLFSGEGNGTLFFVEPEKGRRIPGTAVPAIILLRLITPNDNSTQCVLTQSE
jgi:hypothetical protein